MKQEVEPSPPQDNGDKGKPFPGKGAIMNPMVDPVAAIQPVETAAGAAGTPAIVSTLYDLMSAMQDVVASDEEALVVTAVVHLLRAKRIVFLGDVRQPNLAPLYA
jgi:hypothetical protein